MAAQPPTGQSPLRTLLASWILRAISVSWNLIALYAVLSWLFWRVPFYSTERGGGGEGPHGQVAPSGLPDSLSYVDRVLGQLEWANSAFFAPLEMLEEEGLTVVLSVSQEDSLQALQERLSPLGEAQGDRIRVSTRMLATLKGNGFQVIAREPETQALGSGQTLWSWQVTPEKRGRHSLFATLSALLFVDGKETPAVVRRFDQSVMVHGRIIHDVRMFVVREWKWVWTAILVPVGVWLWRRKDNKERRVLIPR